MASNRVAVVRSKAASWSLQMQLRRFLLCSCCWPSPASPFPRGTAENGSIRHGNAGIHQPSGRLEQLCILSQPLAASTEVEPPTCSSQPTSSTISPSATVVVAPAATLTNLSAGHRSVQQCAGSAFSPSSCSDGTQGPAAQQNRLQSALLARRQQRCPVLELVEQTRPGEAAASCQVSGNSSLCTPIRVLQPLLVVEHSSPEVYTIQAVQQSSLNSIEGVGLSRPSLQAQASNRRRSCYADTPTGLPQESVLQQHTNHSPPWHVKVTSASAHGSPQHSTEAVDLQESENFLTLLQQGKAVSRSSSSNSSSSAKCDLAAHQAGESVVSSFKQHRNQSSNTANVRPVFVDAVCDDSLLPDWHECDDELSSPTGRRLMELQDESLEAEQHQPQQQDGPEHSTQRQQQERYEEGSELVIPAAGGMDYAESVNRIMALLESFTSATGEGPMEGQLYEVLRLSVLGPVVETVTVRAASSRLQGLNSMDVVEVFSRFTDEWPEDAERDARNRGHDEFGRPLYVSELPGIGAFAGSSTCAELDWGLNGLLRQGSEDGYVTAVEVSDEAKMSLGVRRTTYVTSCPAVALSSAAWGPATCSSTSMVQGIPLCRPATG